MRCEQYWLQGAIRALPVVHEAVGVDFRQTDCRVPTCKAIREGIEAGE